MCGAKRRMMLQMAGRLAVSSHMRPYLSPSTLLLLALKNILMRKSLDIIGLKC